MPRFAKGRNYILTIFFLLLTTTNAQNNSGATHFGLAEADLARNDDIFAIFNNPASQAFSETRTVGIFYSPFPFGLKELAFGNLAYNEPTNFGNFSLGFSTFGFELYKETEIAFSYSNKLFTNINVGLSVFHKTIKIKRYGSANTLDFTFGCIFELYNNFSIGFIFENPIRSSAKEVTNSRLYKLGISYSPIINSAIYFALSKEINFTTSLHSGIEYRLIDFLSLRLGIQNEPDIFTGGIGINYSIFSLNYAIGSHTLLGHSHVFDIILQL